MRLLFLGSFSIQAPAAELALANSLAKEGDWSACLAECKRVEVAQPGLPDVQALHAQAAAQLAVQPPSRSRWRRVGEWPIRGLVGFYRFTIAPAIGSRCVLQPSCSRYALESARRAGWLSLPMTGDRLIREPSVVQDGAHPVSDAEGRIRYADPVEDHLGGCR